MGGARARRLRTLTPGGDKAVVAGVRISHPERPIYPELGIAKIDLAPYFDAVGPWILPHVQGRPLTLVHCPAGVAKGCLFLRHAKAWGPSALRRVRIREKTKIGEYLVADSREAVVALAQMGIVEIHTWNSTIDDLDSSICAYSPRARAGAPVSMPLAWTELRSRAPWTLPVVTRRLRRRADPWADYWGTRQDVTTAALRAVRAL